jgi:DNA-binding response OmpR family regulator
MDIHQPPTFIFERDIVATFGPDALDHLKQAGIKPSFQPAYSRDQIDAALLTTNCPRPAEALATSRKVIADKGTFTVAYRDQTPVFLGNTITFRLAARLARRPNVYVDFENLKADVWEDHLASNDTISRAIRRLRKEMAGLKGITLATQPYHVGLMLD